MHVQDHASSPTGGVKRGAPAQENREIPNKTPYTGKGRSEKTSPQPLTSGRPRRRSARLGSFVEEESLDESGDGIHEARHAKGDAEQAHAGTPRGEANHTATSAATGPEALGVGDPPASAPQFTSAAPDVTEAAARFPGMGPDAQFAAPFGLAPGAAGFMGPYGGMFGGMGGLPPGIGMPQDPSGQSQADQRTFYAFLQGMAFAEARRAAMHGQQQQAQAHAQAQNAHSAAPQVPPGVDPAMMAYLSTMMGSSPAQFPPMGGLPNPMQNAMPGGLPGNMPGSMTDFNMPWQAAAQMPTMPLASPSHAGIGMNPTVAKSPVGGVDAAGAMANLAASQSPRKM